MELRARIHDPAQIVALGEILARAARLCPQSQVFVVEPPKLEQVLYAADQLPVVPRLGEVVRGAFLHQGNGALQRRPCGHEQDRQVRIELADGTKQLRPLAAGGLILREVHVLDDHTHVLGADERERVVRRHRGEDLEIVELEEDLERHPDGFLIVDHEHFRHRRVSSGVHRVAADGGTRAARSAGISDASQPVARNSSAWPATIVA